MRSGSKGERGSSGDGDSGLTLRAPFSLRRRSCQARGNDAAEAGTAVERRRGVPAELLGALLRALGGGARPPAVSAPSSPGRRERAGGEAARLGRCPGSRRSGMLLARPS